MNDGAKSEARALAERIYDLDTDVYNKLESILGRVYNDDRERCVERIISMINSKVQHHTLNKEIAMISNMARTIGDKEVSRQLVQEARSITKQVNAYTREHTVVDILDKTLGQLNAIPLKSRFSERDSKIICIAKAYGSGGTEIGYNLAQALGLGYYDSIIIREIMNRMDKTGRSVWGTEDFYEKRKGDAPVYNGQAFKTESSFSFAQMKEDFVKYHGLPKSDAMFFMESEFMKKLAKKKNFLVVDRYAEAVLTYDRVPHVSIFISAPFETRVQRLAQVHEDKTEAQLRKMLKKIDDEDHKIYKKFTGDDWGAADNYDITLNAANYGIQGTVDLLLHLLESEMKF